MLSIMIKHGLYMAVSLGVGIARFIPRTAPAAAGRAAAQHMTQEHHPLSDANITNKPGVPTASEEPPDPTDRSLEERTGQTKDYDPASAAREGDTVQDNPTLRTIKSDAKSPRTPAHAMPEEQAGG